MIHYTPQAKVSQVTLTPPNPFPSPAEQSLPPATTIPAAVRKLNTILNQLCGSEAVAALNAGDCCAKIDPEMWAEAWEQCRIYKDLWLLTLARETRNQWRNDIGAIIAKQPEFNHPRMIDKALDVRLRIVLGFAFRFLTRRHICFLADALVLAFESDLKPFEFVKELANSATRATHCNAQALDALTLGASFMHRLQPERLLSSTKPIENYGQG